MRSPVENSTLVGAAYDGCRIKKSVAIGSDFILLLDPDERPGSVQFPNLIRITGDDAIIWRAKLPSMPYVFVDFNLDDADGIEASSFSGYVVKIDMSTGEELSRAWTK